MPEPKHSWYVRPMDAYTFPHRTASLALLLTTTFLSGAMALGCNQEDAKADNAPGKPSFAAPSSVSPQPGGQPQPSAAEPAPKSGLPEYKEAAFNLTLSPPKSVKAGAPAEFTIVLSAQGGYKVNQEYPIKFQFNDEKGVTPQKKIVRKDDGQVEKSKATIPLTVTIQSPGKHSISGKLSFSVCTEERCLIEKRDLKLEVDAS